MAADSMDMMQQRGTQALFTGHERLPEVGSSCFWRQGSGDLVSPYCSIGCDQGLTRISLVPDGTNVLIHTFSIHRDARNFSNPDTFLPERWLTDGRPNSITNHNPDAFIPFSLGPQNCVGKKIAMTELRVVVAFVVQRIDIVSSDGPGMAGWEEGIEDWFATSCPALLAQVKARP